MLAETRFYAGVRSGILPVAAATMLLGGLGAATAADLLVVIDGIEPKKGQVFMRFCDKGPLDACQQFGAMQPAVAETVGFRFTEIPAGDYAFVGFQDINGNGKADFNFIGMPTEPFTLSNDAGKKLVPPPDFDDVKVTIADGEKENVVRLNMQTVLGGMKKAKVAMPLDKVPILAVLDPVPPPPTKPK